MPGAYARGICPGHMKVPVKVPVKVPLVYIMQSGITTMPPPTELEGPAYSTSLIALAWCSGIVDRMNDVLVQEVNLFLDSSFERVAEMKNAMCQAQANGKQNRDYLQIDFVIEQFAKVFFRRWLAKRPFRKIITTSTAHRINLDLWVEESKIENRNT